MTEKIEQTTFLEFEEEEDDKVDEMSEKDRIQFIREKGTEEMIMGLKAVFDNNRWKPKREEMWEERLDQGKRMVRTIMEKED